MSIFGPIITDTQVENRVRDQLRLWLPSYLDETARQDSFASVAHPLSYETIRDRVTKWTEQALPAVIIEIGGTVATRRIGSEYRVVYACNVAAVIGGQTRANTRQLAGIYGAAIAAALVQHGDLDGFAGGVEWTDTAYDSISEDRSRTIMAVVVSLDVAVNAVLDVAMGPAGPPPPEGDPDIPGLPDYGHAATVDAAVTITTGAP